MSRRSLLMVLAIAALAVMAPIAQAETGPSARTTIDPLAVSYLRGHGYSPAQIEAWTVGPCSREAKPAACYGPSKGASLASTEMKIDPLAASYLRELGLSPTQIQAFAAGDCSQKVKPARCYQSSASPVPAQTIQSDRFDWADAGIGAGATLGLILLVGGLGAGLVTSRQNRRRHVRST